MYYKLTWQTTYPAVIGGSWLQSETKLVALSMFEQHQGFQRSLPLQEYNSNPPRIGQVLLEALFIRS
jgi:hypothetical protein